VAVYGLGYFWIGQDVIRNTAIGKMGIIGKALVFVLLTPGWLNGIVTIPTAGAGTADLVFYCLVCPSIDENARWS
jgi:hypothetical protein